MSKITKKKKTLRTKADRLFSIYIRNRDKFCVRCGKSGNLQCAHIISRAVLATRYDDENALTLCPNCHINFAHKNPLLFSEFIYKRLGEKKYWELIEKGKRIGNLKPDFYEEVINKLNGEQRD